MAVLEAWVVRVAARSSKYTGRRMREVAGKLLRSSRTRGVIVFHLKIGTRVLFFAACWVLIVG